MIDVQVVAETVRRRMDLCTGELRVCWVQVDQDRSNYAASLRQDLHDVPVAVLVVQRVRFDNPNAVLEDLVHVITENRHNIEDAVRSDGACSGRIGLLLVSRSGLCIPQLSSPVILPDWFPIYGGKSISTTIEDITWTADCALNHQVLCIEEVAALLFRLEGVILGRLVSIAAQDHRAGNALLCLMRRRTDPPETFGEIFSRAEQSRHLVHNPGSFRPSVRKGDSLVARLWDLVSQHGHEKLAGPSRALADALALPSELGFSPYESIMAAFGRPTNPDTDAASRFARNLLLTILASCQLITAAAHADAYSRYPYSLLKAASFDLRRSLHDAIAVMYSD